MEKVEVLFQWRSSSGKAPVEVPLHWRFFSSEEAPLQVLLQWRSSSGSSSPVEIVLLTSGWLFLTRHTILVASSSSGRSSGTGGRMGSKSRWATES